MSEDAFFWVTLSGAVACGVAALGIGFGDAIARWWRRRLGRKP